jgi:hypothetical protein
MRELINVTTASMRAFLFKSGLASSGDISISPA